jgi:tetratricopeptide (TPR) repeat protein
VLKFLAGYVKHDRAALAWLEQRTQGVGLDESFQLRYKAPHPVPPTGRQIVSLLDRQGAEKTRALLQTMAADLDRDALLWAGKTLFNSHRRADAVTVFTWATELYPQSAQVHQALGDLLKAGHAAPHAKAAYTKALSLIADDPDLTDPERADAREEIQEALDALDKEY